MFGVTPHVLLNMPDGRVMHCEFRIGDARLFLSEELPEHGGTPSPMRLGGTSVATHVYVDDCDKMVVTMRSHGAEVLMEPADMFGASALRGSAIRMVMSGASRLSYGPCRQPKSKLLPRRCLPKCRMSRTIGPGHGEVVSSWLPVPILVVVASSRSVIRCQSCCSWKRWKPQPL